MNVVQMVRSLIGLFLKRVTGVGDYERVDEDERGVQAANGKSFLGLYTHNADQDIITPQPTMADPPAQCWKRTALR